MLILCFLFAAPVLQIALSLLRIGSRIALPIRAITFLMIILGIVLSFSSMTIIAADIPVTKNHSKCGMPEAAAFMTGILITIFAVPLIGAIASLVYYLKMKNEKDLANSTPAEH